jgi:hypothetical protein
MQKNLNTGIDTPSRAYVEMAEGWSLARCLVGGTRDMRLAGQTYLPKEPQEQNDWYEARLERAVLFPGFAKALRNLTGKAFASSVSVTDASDQWLEWFENIDLAGSTLQQFCERVFLDGLTYGHTTILAEYPVVQPTATLFEERNVIRARPYLLNRSASQIIGWRTQTVDNQTQLTRVRIREEYTDYADEWDDDGETYQVRVLFPGGYQVYREDADGAWGLAHEGTVSIKDKIPLVPVYFDKAGEMMSRVPLGDLAWTNVAHWQSYSDQRTILRVARVPIIFVSGASEDELGGQITIGPNTFMAIQNPNANMRFVEHSGAAISAGRQDCLDLEERMYAQAAEPMMSRPGSDTATGRAIDARDAVSPLAVWVANFEHCINRALEMMAEYGQVDAAPKVQMTRDFGILGNTSDLDALLRSRQLGEISRKTFLDELKRRGVLSELFDPEADAEEASMEGPTAQPMAGGFGALQGEQPPVAEG